MFSNIGNLSKGTNRLTMASLFGVRMDFSPAAIAEVTETFIVTEIGLAVISTMLTCKAIVDKALEFNLK